MIDPEHEGRIQPVARRFPRRLLARELAGIAVETWLEAAAISAILVGVSAWLWSSIKGTGLNFDIPPTTERDGNLLVEGDFGERLTIQQFLSRVPRSGNGYDWDKYFSGDSNRDRARVTLKNVKLTFEGQDQFNIPGEQGGKPETNPAVLVDLYTAGDRTSGKRLPLAIANIDTNFELIPSALANPDNPAKEVEGDFTVQFVNLKDENGNSLPNQYAAILLGRADPAKLPS